MKLLRFGWPILAIPLVLILLPLTAITLAQPAIPHILEGRSACTGCHTIGGAGVGEFGGTGMPDNHQGRADETCTGCHQGPAGAPGKPTASPTPIPLSLPQTAFLPLLPRDPTPTPVPTPTATPTPRPVPNDIGVLQNTSFTYSLSDSLEVLTVIAELKNVSAQILSTGIQIVFFDSSGAIVGVRGTRSFNDALPYESGIAPGDRTYLRFETMDIPPGWVRYEFNLAPGQASYVPVTLAATDINPVYDTRGRRRFLGAIVNDAYGCPWGQCLAYVQVVTFDESGGLINAGQSAMMPNGSPGAKTYFDVIMPGPGDFSRFEVKVYGDRNWGLPPTATPIRTTTPTPTRTATPTSTATPTATAGVSG